MTDEQQRQPTGERLGGALMVGRWAELAAKVGAGLVRPHQDDLLGTEQAGRQHRQQADRRRPR